jgi:hypothetical protein
MILKVLDYRQGKEQNHVFEEWNYFDNIVSASSYYDEDDKLPVVRCRFRDDSIVTIHIPNVAYLMSDTGKTIDKIVPADVDELGDTEPIYNTLQDAVAEAMS